MKIIKIQKCDITIEEDYAGIACRDQDKITGINISLKPSMKIIGHRISGDEAGIVIAQERE